MTLKILRNRETTAVCVKNDLKEVHGVKVIEKTVRRRLQEYGLTAGRPAHGPQFIREYRVERLRFGREHQNWVNKDESRFRLSDPDGRQRI